MEDKFSIKVNVADRYYPLKIERSDEEKIRKAAKMINDKVLQYKQRYTDKDVQDFLAMAALQFVIKLIECEGKFDNAAVTEELSELDEWLGSYIEKQNLSSFKQHCPHYCLNVFAKLNTTLLGVGLDLSKTGLFTASSGFLFGTLEV